MVRRALRVTGPRTFLTSVIGTDVPWMVLFFADIGVMCRVDSCDWLRLAQGIPVGNAQCGRCVGGIVAEKRLPPEARPVKAHPFILKV